MAGWKERARDLAREVSALSLALKRRDTPWYAKAMCALTVGYALSPLDLIPDFIPVLGYLDDLVLLPALAWLSLRLIPPDVLAACRAEARDMWAGGKPKRWYFALPVAALWALLLWLVVRRFLI